MINRYYWISYCHLLFLFLLLAAVVSSESQILKLTNYTTTTSSKDNILLSNQFLSIVFSTDGLTEIVDNSFKRVYNVSNDGFQITIDEKVLNEQNMVLSDIQNDSTTVSFHYSYSNQSTINIKVVYTLLPNWKFFTKVLYVFVPSFSKHRIDANTEESNVYLVNEVFPFLSLKFGESFSQLYSKDVNPCGRSFTIVLFMRTTDGLGLFTGIENPFYLIDTSPEQELSLHYDPGVNGTVDEWIPTDMAFIGSYRLSKHWVSGSEVNPAERDAFSTLVDNFLIAPPTTKSNKVHVAWDISDYQLDVTTQHGREQYFRIIDRLAQLGIRHVVTQQSNTAVGVRQNATDGWGWESTLWLALGEKIREGYWYPGDPIPPTVQVMLDYAESKGVSYLAYVYPILAFSANPSWLVNVDGRVFATLANVDLQEWLLKTMILFQEVTGVGGYAFDYTFFWDPYHTQYSQWKGWMNVVRNLRLLKPSLKIDNRQEAHCYGPWYMLHGSYSEPLASDENPETYSIINADLSTDRIAALQLRSVNFWYRQELLLPMNVIPGFTFHQQERYYANSTLAWQDWLIRDFDYLGYQYSLLSNVATAGINMVFTYLPARDLEEFTKLPQKDILWIQSWLNFTDENIRFLRYSIPILGQPGPGKIDGNSAFMDNEGFIFLFNPNYYQTSTTIVLDESVNLIDGGVWIINEIYPQNRYLFVKSFGQEIEMTMDGTSALVLEFKLFDPQSITSPILFGVSGDISVNTAGGGGAISISNVQGEVGTAQDVLVLLPQDLGNATSVTMNGVFVKWTLSGNYIYIRNIVFPGLYFPHSAQIPLKAQSGDDATESYIGNFVVPSSVINQLQTRNTEYPINWKLGDLTATWLLPQRLLLFVSFLQPNDAIPVLLTIDGGFVNLLKAYETRDHVTSNRFTGYYADLSLIVPDVTHQVMLSFPTTEEKLQQQTFVGLFFEHVETIFTSQLSQQ